MKGHRITAADVRRARKLFVENEPRDLFYRAATELVDLALRSATQSVTVTEALAVLLQTWNKAFYQYRKFDNDHFAALDALLARHQAALTRYRGRTLEQVDQREALAVVSLFQEFESVLGPVGAAKVLHLLAPRVFPLWDRRIAEAYGLALQRAGTNGERYWRFLLVSQEQYRALLREDPSCRNPLKSIDEYNYCKYTARWL